MTKAKSARKKLRTRQLVRPEFKPAWTEAEAFEATKRVLAPDHFSAVAVRLAAITLARTPEELMRGALSGDEPEKKSPAEDVIKLLRPVKIEEKVVPPPLTTSE